MRAECLPRCSRQEKSTTVASTPLPALTGFTSSHSHGRAVWRVCSTTSDVAIRPAGSGPPNQRLTAFQAFCLWCLGDGFVKPGQSCGVPVHAVCLPSRHVQPDLKMCLYRAIVHPCPRARLYDPVGSFPFFALGAPSGRPRNNCSTTVGYPPTTIGQHPTAVGDRPNMTQCTVTHFAFFLSPLLDQGAPPPSLGHRFSFERCHHSTTVPPSSTVSPASRQYCLPPSCIAASVPA